MQTIRGRFLRKPRAIAEINAEIKKPSYHKTWDDDKALIKPFLSSHVGIDLIREAIRPLPTPAQSKAGGGGGN